MFPLPSFINLARAVAFDVWVSDPALASDLARFLHATAYEPGRVRGNIFSVRPPAGLAEDVARVELDIYLRLWRRRHPSETAEIVG
jgi:hypothetical protein